MRTPKVKTLRIRDWEHRFEKNRTREISVMTWRPEPTDLSDDVYLDVVSHPDGASHYGVLTALRNVAARGKPRGTLTMENGAPHTAKTLALKTRLPENVIEAAVERLLKIGELENSTRKSRVTSHILPQEGAVIPQAGAGTPHPDKKRLEEKTSSTSEEKKSEKKQRARELSRSPQQRTADRKITTSSFVDADDDPGSEQTPTPSQSAGAADPPPPGKTAEPSYATPADELKALHVEYAGAPITQELLDHVRSRLGGEISQQFVQELRTHRGPFRNYQGFLRDHVNKPRHAASAAKIAQYQCELCGSDVPGVGLRLQGREVVACSCANADYVAEKIADGTITAQRKTEAVN